METHELVPAPKKKPKAAKKKVGGKKASELKRELKISFSQPGGESEKCFKSISVSAHNYLARRQDKLRLVLGMGRNGEFMEIPFVDGMQESTFVELLITFGIIKGGNVGQDFYSSLGLVCRKKAVYYDREGLEVEADEAGNVSA